MGIIPQLHLQNIAKGNSWPIKYFIATMRIKSWARSVMRKRFKQAVKYLHSLLGFDKSENIKKRKGSSKLKRRVQEKDLNLHKRSRQYNAKSRKAAIPKKK